MLHVAPSHARGSSSGRAVAMDIGFRHGGRLMKGTAARRERQWLVSIASLQILIL